MPTTPLQPGDRILLSGVSGFLGRHIAAAFRVRGVEVVPLNRPQSRVQSGSIAWDPAQNLLDPEALRGFRAVIHLSGEPVAAIRWTAAKKRRILESRVRSTTLLAESIARCSTPPAVLLCASGINVYGQCGEAIVEESRPAGQGFLPAVCRAWEAATQPAEAVCRVAHLRIGVVLGRDGGMLPSLLPLFRLGLGGRVGSGRQWVSWIAVEDLVRSVEHTIVSDQLSGPVNLVSPAPVTNRQFSQTLARALHRRAPLPAPAWLLKLCLGQFAQETILSSVRAVPQKLEESGFAFHYAHLQDALVSLRLREP